MHLCKLLLVRHQAQSWSKQEQSLPQEELHEQKLVLAAIPPIVVIVSSISIRVTPRTGKNVLLLLSPVGRSLAASSFRLASCEG